MHPYQLNWGDLSPSQFLKEYWQKKPLLIRQAFSNFKPVISADELAGLSCEEGVESRILIEHGLEGETPWQVKHGPQQEDIFNQLPETHWTLLVQEANQYLDELGALIDCFNFIPNWRFDDVMISYAPEYGSVGPHTDQYDVFLIQAEGQRHWHIADYATSDDDYITDIECQILKEMQIEQDWVLNPGDMLYLPPGIIHHGIALNDCQTYSVGYRAPTGIDTLSSILEFLGDKTGNNRRYTDPKLILGDNGNGEITQEALAQLIDNMQTLLSDKNLVSELLGCHLTETPHSLYLSDLNLETGEQLLAYLKRGNTLQRSEAARLAFIRQEDGNNLLFINGEKHETSPAVNNIIPIISGERYLSFNKIQQYTNQETITFLLNLIQRGIFHG